MSLLGPFAGLEGPSFGLKGPSFGLRGFFLLKRFLCWPEKGLFKSIRALSGRLRAPQADKGPLFAENGPLLA